MQRRQRITTYVERASAAPWWRMWNRDPDYFEVELEVEGQALPYDHGRHGHPEDWYPPEGGYVDDVEVVHWSAPDAPPGWTFDGLTEAEEDRAADDLWQACGDDYERAAEDRFDLMREDYP